MKALNLITLLLVIVGAINWGLVALGGPSFDIVATIFGGQQTSGARIVYALVGLSGLYQLIPLFGAFGSHADNPQRVGTHADTVHGTRTTTHHRP